MNGLSQVVDILLVEDNPAHAKLIQRNLRRAGVTNPIHHIDNGREALDFLFFRGRYEKRQRAPHLLVLLDLNMPQIDGYHVLETLKANEQARLIPVVILTTTDDPQEIQKCYDLGCNAFITKPVTSKLFSQTIQDLGLFIKIVAVPGGL